MSLSGSSELLRLDHDLPTTEADVIALRRLRHAPRVSLDDYLRLLAALAAPLSTLRARKGPRGDQPFALA